MAAGVKISTHVGDATGELYERMTKGDMSTRILIGTGTCVNAPLAVAEEISDLHNKTLPKLSPSKRARFDIPPLGCSLRTLWQLPSRPQHQL
eukprot:m.275974 g.275974  ORF g.275974 m.275974 type:complete len:92 (+) comp11100_c2_seq10:1190-1465(+)